MTCLRHAESFRSCGNIIRGPRIALIEVVANAYDAGNFFSAKVSLALLQDSHNRHVFTVIINKEKQDKVL